MINNSICIFGNINTDKHEKIVNIFKKYKTEYVCDINTDITEPYISFYGEVISYSELITLEASYTLKQVLNKESTFQCSVCGIQYYLKRMCNCLEKNYDDWGKVF